MFDLLLKFLGVMPRVKYYRPASGWVTDLRTGERYRQSVQVVQRDAKGRLRSKAVGA
jgi:hypothetical protein